MLLCKTATQPNKTLRQSSDYEISHQISSASISVKIESMEDETKICRVCLKEGTIPIYTSNEESELSEALKTFGDIYIYADDEYPKHLCQSCHDLLQGAILLRKTAQQSDEKLRFHSDLGTESNNYNDSDNHLTECNDHTGDLRTSYKHKNKKVLKQEVHKCKPCNLDFETLKALKDHQYSIEHEEKKQTCPICNKTFTSIYFKRHMTLHKHDKTLMCDICGKEFLSRNHFTKHRLTHFYDLPYHCTLCPYRGRFPESLKLHMRSHTGEKPFQCTICSSKFVYKSNLSKHMMTHNGKHDFKCEDCGRGFYTKKNLEMHFKVDHTGIKDHVCNICGKAFGYRKQMMKHQLKVHKREKLRSGRLPLYLQVQAKEAKEGQRD